MPWNLFWQIVILMLIAFFCLNILMHGAITAWKGKVK